MISPRIIEYESEIHRLHCKQEYRPTAVNLLYRLNEKNPEFLLVQSSKVDRTWYFPHGGIESNEDLSTAFYRELNEELSIPPQDLSKLNLNFLYQKLNAENERINLRGFKRGKAYFYNLANYIGDGNFRLDSTELDNFRWRDYETALDILRMSNRREKADLNIFALNQAVKIINGN